MAPATMRAHKCGSVPVAACVAGSAMIPPLKTNATARPPAASCSRYARTGISGRARSLASSSSAARSQSSSTVISIDHGDAALQDQNRVGIHLHHDTFHLHLDLPLNADHHPFNGHAHL